MEQLVYNITSYLDYLNSECGLSTSIHLAKDKLHRVPQEVLQKLLPYNSHSNPYCIMVKGRGNNLEKCIRTQESILENSNFKGSFCKTCYAGVSEYIHLIYESSNPIGFIAVSGYQGTEPPEDIIDRDLWKDLLIRDQVPWDFCETVIPPLGRMFELLFKYPTKHSSSEYDLILQFINEHHTQVTLEAVCNHFYRSKSYISHLFKKTSGMTLRAYCNQLKLEDAKRLLLTTDVPVTQIALDTGFNDVSYFIKAFRETFGITPLKYRNQNKE